MLAWLQFAFCAALIGVAGTVLSRYGDVIAARTGMGGTWVGLILLATVTSFPELMTGASAVTVAAAPDIAVGDALGSCVCNLALLVILDVLHRKASIYSLAGQGHILAAGFGVMLLGFVGFNVLAGRYAQTPALGHVALSSVMIAILYAVAMLTVFRYERAQRRAFVAERVGRYPDITLRQAGLRYSAAAAAVTAGGWLPFAGEAVAQAMRWDRTFVGTSFVALATSLPEMA